MRVLYRHKGFCIDTIFKYYWRGSDTFSGEDNSVKIGLPPFCNGVYSNRKEIAPIGSINLLPVGANSFLLE